jgi:hypothetical protein
MSLDNLKRHSQRQDETTSSEDLPDFHIEDDEFEMEEDKKRILKQLISKYEDYESLKSQDQLTTLSEVLLEFELEKILRQKKELIHKRAANQLKQNDSGPIISSVTNNVCDYAVYRKRRTEQTERMMEKPSLSFPKTECIQLQKEVRGVYISVMKCIYLYWNLYRLH